MCTDHPHCTAGRAPRKRLVACIPEAPARALVSQLNFLWEAARWAGVERTCPLAGGSIDALWDLAYGNTEPGGVRVVEVR